MGPSKAKPPTRAERRRLAMIVELGCVACRIECRGGYSAPEVHHLVDGGKRLGHAAAVGLCPWHHRGAPRYGWNTALMTSYFGPSLHHDARAFHSRYGEDEALLAFQNRLIEQAVAEGKGEPIPLAQDGKRVALPADVGRVGHAASRRKRV